MRVMDTRPAFIAAVAASAAARHHDEPLAALLARVGFTRLAEVDLGELAALAEERVRDAAHVVASGDAAAAPAARAELKRALCAAMPAARVAARQVLGRDVTPLALYAAAAVERTPTLFEDLMRATRKACPASAARVERALTYEPDVRVRGKTAALTFTPTVARDGRTRVVNVDAACARADGTFDWKGKVTMMLSPSRMLALYAALRGKTAQFASRGHGAQHDKWIALERQHDAARATTSLYCTVGQRGARLRAVPIGLSDAQLVAALLAMQLRHNMPAACSIADLDALALEAVRNEAPEAPSQQAHAGR